MKALIPRILAVLLFFCIPMTGFAHSGCCSAHGGVSGCGCADGTPLSATCLPYYPECSGAAATGSTPTDTFTPVPLQEPSGTATPLPPTAGPLFSPGPVARPTFPEPHPTHPTRRMRHTHEMAISSKPSGFLSSLLSFFSGIFGGRRAHTVTPLSLRLVSQEQQPAILSVRRRRSTRRILRRICRIPAVRPDPSIHPSRRLLSSPPSAGQDTPKPSGRRFPIPTH
jgi:hypothetical protein